MWVLGVDAQPAPDLQALDLSSLFRTPRPATPEAKPEPRRVKKDAAGGGFSALNQRTNEPGWEAFNGQGRPCGREAASAATAEHPDVVERGVVAEASGPLDFGLQAAHALGARVAPVPVVSPAQPGPLQLLSVRAAEAHVVRRRVVPGGRQGLHAEGEGHQEAGAGAPQRLAPGAPAAGREGQARGGRGKGLTGSPQQRVRGMRVFALGDCALPVGD